MRVLGRTKPRSDFGPIARSRRQAFSVVEIVVVIAVITILTSLILPAVMRARESARRTQCMNNLRQVGLALQAFESTYHRYPLLFDSDAPRDYAPHARLLPYLEEDAVYNTINFAPRLHGDRDTTGIDVEARDRERAQFARVRVDVFLCPSDPYSRGADFGGTNYRANAGTFPTLGCSRTPDPLGGDGFFYFVKAPRQSGGRAGAIRDGLSNTVAFAERTVGTPLHTPYPEGNSFAVDPFEETGVPCWSRDQWIRRCSALTPDHPEINTTVGHWWLYGGFGHTWYNHILVPNSKIPDCATDPPLNVVQGIVTARSWHRGGVNVSMGDAQARFISERIDLDVWRALGTRNSGEAIDAGDY